MLATSAGNFLGWLRFSPLTRIRSSRRNYYFAASEIPVYSFSPLTRIRSSRRDEGKEDGEEDGEVFQSPDEDSIIPEFSR